MGTRRFLRTTARVGRLYSRAPATAALIVVRYRRRQMPLDRRIAGCRAHLVDAVKTPSGIRHRIYNAGCMAIRRRRVFTSQWSTVEGRDAGTTRRTRASSWVRFCALTSTFPTILAGLRRAAGNAGLPRPEIWSLGGESVEVQLRRRRGAAGRCSWRTSARTRGKRLTTSRRVARAQLRLARPRGRVTIHGQTTQPLVDRFLDLAKASMGEPAFQAASSRGQAMSLKQAIQFALEDRESGVRPGSARVRPRSDPGLTRIIKCGRPHLDAVYHRHHSGSRRRRRRSATCARAERLDSRRGRHAARRSSA